MVKALKVWEPRCGKFFFLAGIFFMTTQIALRAEEISPLEEFPGLREQAVVMRIVSRIVEQNQMIVWNSENTKVTIPGQPVGLRLEGSNLVVAAQFTLFLLPAGQHILVAKGQIWINIPNEGISYHTILQTIPLDFLETVYFFPLGSRRSNDGARIEIQLTLEPYMDSQANREARNPDSP